MSAPLLRDMVGILPFAHHLSLGIHLPPDVQIFTGGPQLIVPHFPIRQGLCKVIAPHAWNDSPGTCWRVK